MQKFRTLSAARQAAAAHQDKTSWPNNIIVHNGNGTQKSVSRDVIAVKVWDCAAGQSFYAIRHEPETDKVYL